MADEKKQVATSTATKWKISKLKEHPQQAAMFGDVDDRELEALTENMQKHGLRIPIEILPDGTIVTGHQRVRAATRLSWKEIDVVIRHDLAAEGAVAVERHFVEDNFVRRQLSPLERAKCIRRLMELETGRAAEMFGFRKEELKNRIATRMGLSIRSVNRYLLLLDTPVEIQKAFDGGEVSLIMTGKIAMLDKKVKAEISRRIRGGEEPAALVKEYTQPSGESDATREAGKAFVRLVSALDREVPKIRGQVEHLHRGRLRNSAPVVKDAVELLKAVAAVTATKPQ